MAETVVVRQKSDFSTEFLAAGERTPPGTKPQPVARLHELTPYGMLLASVGSCTTVVLHTFAQSHGIGLKEVEITLSYDRVFDEDCRDCDKTRNYTEEITETLKFKGKLTDEEKGKLLKVAHYCPIFKIVEKGLKVHSILAE